MKRRRHFKLIDILMPIMYTAVVTVKYRQRYTKHVENVHCVNTRHEYSNNNFRIETSPLSMIHIYTDMYKYIYTYAYAVSLDRKK